MKTKLLVGSIMLFSLTYGITKAYALEFIAPKDKDYQCSVGTITNRAKVDLPCGGSLLVSGNIDGDDTRVYIHADGDIHVTGKIDGLSSFKLVSLKGSIFIDGKIDGGAKGCLIATNGNLYIGDKVGSNPATAVYWLAKTHQFHEISTPVFKNEDCPSGWIIP